MHKIKMNLNVKNFKLNFIKNKILLINLKKLKNIDFKKNK